MKPAVALNPATPVETLVEVLPMLHHVLVMSVNPGFGGQKYIAAAEAKVAEVRRRFPELPISIDGGIDLETVKPAAAHGANLFVAGTSLFKAQDMKMAIAQMRASAESAYCTAIKNHQL